MARPKTSMNNLTQKVYLNTIRAVGIFQIIATVLVFLGQTLLLMPSRHPVPLLVVFRVISLLISSGLLLFSYLRRWPTGFLSKLGKGFIIWGQFQATFLLVFGAVSTIQAQILFFAVTALYSLLYYLFPAQKKSHWIYAPFTYLLYFIFFWLRGGFSFDELAWRTAFLANVIGIPLLHMVLIYQKLIHNKVLKMSQEQENRLNLQIHYDAQTGLPNGFFVERALAEIPAGIKNPDRIAMGLLRIEGLDHLNAKFGFEETNKRLLAFIQVLSSALHEYTIYDRNLFLEPSEQLYRIEGSVFVFLLRMKSNTPLAPDTLAKDLELLAEDSFQKMTWRNKIGFQGALVLFPDDTLQPTELLKLGLGILRHSGKNPVGSFHVFDPRRFASFHRRESLLEELAQEDFERKLSFVLQPKQDLHTKGCQGFEVLARYKSPVLGQVSPAEFIPLAEDNGTIKAMTLLQIHQLVNLFRIHSHHYQNTDHPIFSFNLSPATLKASFLSKIETAIHGWETWLEVEITEGVLLQEDPEVLNIFKRWKTRGAIFAIDDFGTGYSNLGYLQKFNAQVIKIDKRFIDPLETDPSSKALIEAIIALGRSFQMRIIAEGVETQEQSNILENMGCDAIQGYFYSKPLPPSEAMEKFGIAQSAGTGHVRKSL